MAEKVTIIIAAKNMLTRTLKKAGESVKAFAGKVRSLFNGATLAIAGTTAAVIAISRSLVKAYETQAKAEAKLEAISKATGYASGFTTNELKKQAGQLQKLTGIGDEVIISMQGMLASFKQIRGDQFKRATVAVLDMGAAMRKAGKDQSDVEAAAIQVGKALNDPIRGLSALSRVGVTFTEQQKAQIKAMQEAGDVAGAQRIILRELETEFGGTAKAMGDASHGLDQLKTTFGDLKEVIGKAIVENEAFDGAIKSLTRSMEELITSGDLSDWADGVGRDLGFLIKRARTLVGLFEKSFKFGFEVTGLGVLSRTMDKAKGIFDGVTGRGAMAQSERMLREQQRKLDAAKRDAEQRAAMEKRAEEEAAMARVEAARKASEGLAKAQEEEAKAVADKAQKEYEDWQKREEERLDALKRLGEEEASVKQEIADEIAAEEKRARQAALQDEVNDLKDQIAKRAAIAEGGVEAVLAAARKARSRKERDQAEAEELAMLEAKQGRGIKLGRQARERLDALKKVAKARQGIGGLKDQLGVAQDNLKELAKQTGSLDVMKGTLARIEAQQAQLLAMG